MSLLIQLLSAEAAAESQLYLVSITDWLTDRSTEREKERGRRGVETRDNLIGCRLLFILPLLIIIYYYVWFFSFDDAVHSGPFLALRLFLFNFIILRHNQLIQFVLFFFVFFSLFRWEVSIHFFLNFQFGSVWLNFVVAIIAIHVLMLNIVIIVLEREKELGMRRHHRRPRLPTIVDHWRHWLGRRHR
jgi:hypothetical protein